MHDGSEFTVSRACPPLRARTGRSAGRGGLGRRAGRGRLGRRIPGLALLAGGALVALAAAAAPAGAATAHAPASPGYGWVRLAHLSPNTPPVDVYLYSYGMPNAMIVLRHVAYGTVSPYERVLHGEYTVAMRGAGAPASSTPVLSSNLMVHPGHAYTVAGVGPNKALRLQVLDDRLNTPRGKSLVRVIQASLKEHHVTVKADRATLAYNLPFGSITTYGTDSPGTWTVHAKGGRETWSGQVKLTAGTIHSLVVLDSSRRPGGHRPDGRRGQLRDAERRRGDRARRHGPGARFHATALGGRGDRGRAADPGRRVPPPPGQGRGPARPLREAGRPAPANPAARPRHARGGPSPRGRGARGSSRLVTSPRTSPAGGPHQGGPPGRPAPSAGGSLWPCWPAGWPCWWSAWPAWSR